ncbi:unnamed protein product [Adineta steineri]|uniref:Uncharacterized protein n=1 Tax=Adineta steineri TaxID=433720 RepID=A0A814SEP8_9BILA|nr:unnamed protein product [Adineta steineri]CAF1146210.1 unnamed protein product [Adineta steineri]
MSGTSSIPPDYQNANPLLYTFRNDNTGIQPYFIIVAQFFIFEISLRLWDRVVYGTWLLPSDLIIIKRIPPLPPPPPPPRPPFPLSSELIQSGINSISTGRRSSRIRTIYFLRDSKGILIKTDEKEEMPTFDLHDIVVSVLPLLAHTIWFCFIQSSCMSGANATTWNCYNLFGYRIYNYLFGPFTDFAYEYISKLIILRDMRELRIPLIHHKKRWRNILAMIIFYPALVLSTITFIFVGGLLLPYAFTNVIPMVIVYSFLVVIYAYVVSVITLLIKFYTFVTGKIFSFHDEKLNFIKKQMKKYHFKRRLVIRFGARLFPYLISVLFNLSQYFYYGNDYLGSLTREADSRDLTPYFDRMTNSSQLAHTILTTI